MSFRESLAYIRQEGHIELKEATLAKKIALGVTACTLAFEWGTGNEALLGIIGGHVFQATHATLSTAATAGIVSFTEQTLFGLFAVLSIYNFPKVLNAVRTKLFDNKTTSQNESVRHTSKDYANVWDRFFTVFSLGTSIVAIKDNAKRERTPRQNVKDVLINAGLGACGVIAVAGIGAEVANLGSAMGFQQEANILVDVISSPYTYVGLFGLKTFLEYQKKQPQLTKR